MPALESLRRLGFPARNFACPRSARDENNDRLLLTLFERLRGGASADRRAGPSLADELRAPTGDISARQVLLG
ncbi:hypothetical protein ACFU8Q_12890 [Streptomyces sp. NPDC057543]|uniref:hypothetical protein n=1 Tax=Streptomyces sp. NPDC057543 TaxID=3346163 RepID=UPI0036B238A9